MNNCFDISKKHIITAANRNKYVNSTLHPNRNMKEHDFIYVVEGEWIIGQDDEHFHIKKDDVLILYANRSHYGVVPCTAGSKTMYVHALYAPSDETCSDRQIILKSHIHANVNVKNCFEKIIYAVSAEKENMASAYFDALLCELENCTAKNKDDSIAELIRQMIISSSEILTNTEIAAAFNLGVKTCENIFKNAFNTTLHKYVIDTKLESVKFYLIHFPDMKLSEISENLGFYDEFHMSRLFKKSVGMSPGQYRNEYRPK